MQHHLIHSYMKNAYHQASQSKDLSTQCGAVLVKPRQSAPIGFGHNAFPKHVKKSQDRLVAPNKYLYTEHAERAAIYDAIRHGYNPFGSTLVGTWAACSDCARAVIMCGVTRVVRHSTPISLAPDRWLESIEVADTMLKESGIEVVEWDGTVGVEILFDGTPTKM